MLFSFILRVVKYLYASKIEKISEKSLKVNCHPFVNIMLKSKYVIKTI